MFACCGCGHEWPVKASGIDGSNQGDEGVGIKPSEVRDANGTIIVSGDSVLVTMDLKVGPKTIKKGTKVKKIQLGDYGDNHDISCKIPGPQGGSFFLKSQFVKKLNE